MYWVPVRSLIHAGEIVVVSLGAVTALVCLSLFGTLSALFTVIVMCKKGK